MSINEIVQTAEKKMGEAAARLQTELGKIRAGRATPALLEHIKVEAYGSHMPLSQLATLSNEDNRTLLVNVWDKEALQAVEKAILTSDLGINPSVSGQVFRLVMPPMTEETRKGYVKQVKAEAETARVGVRNARKDANQKAKQAEKDGLIGEDDVRKAEHRIQKATDEAVEKINGVALEKEKELLSF